MMGVNVESNCNWRALADRMRSIRIKDTEQNESEEIILEVIDYLLSGGVGSALQADIHDPPNKKQAIQCGLNNWWMRSNAEEMIQDIMPKVLPQEINRLIIYMICL